jgi:hypothetical protein
MAEPKATDKLLRMIQAISTDTHIVFTTLKKGIWAVNVNNLEDTACIAQIKSVYCLTVSPCARFFVAGTNSTKFHNKNKVIIFHSISLKPITEEFIVKPKVEHVYASTDNVFFKVDKNWNCIRLVENDGLTKIESTFFRGVERFS